MNYKAQFSLMKVVGAVSEARVMSMMDLTI